MFIIDGSEIASMSTNLRSRKVEICFNICMNGVYPTTWIHYTQDVFRYSIAPNVRLID